MQFNELNRDLMININGKILHRSEAGISPFDASVQAGDAVFEEMRLYNGKVFRINEHIERLQNSAKALNYDAIPESDYLINETRKTIQANGMQNRVKIKLILSRGPKHSCGIDPLLNNECTFIIIAEHVIPSAFQEYKLLTSSIRQSTSDSLDPKIKSINQLNAVLAKIQANTTDYNDAILLDQNGFVVSTSSMNLFIVDHGMLIIPEQVYLAEPISVRTIIDICEENRIGFIHKYISISEVYCADEVFCSSIANEIITVTNVDGRKVGRLGNNPFANRINQLYQNVTSQEGMSMVEYFF